MRVCRPSLVLTLVIAAIVGCAQKTQADDWIELFNALDFTGWSPRLENNAELPESFGVEGGVIVCKGNPKGYIQTNDEYENYVLEVDWRWPDVTQEKGNSGILVHKTVDASSVGIWPKSIEIQLKKNDAGEFWVIDESIDVDNPEERVSNRQRKKSTTDKVEKPLGEWNHVEITCQGDTIDVKVNGTPVNHGTKASTSKGHICLQSEGLPIEFRKVRLKKL